MPAPNSSKRIATSLLVSLMFIKRLRRKNFAFTISFENKSLKIIAAFSLILFLFYLLVLPELYQAFKDEPVLVWPLWSPDANSVIVNDKFYNQADYMSLFPFILFFFLGVFISKTYYKDKSKHMGHHYKGLKPICFLGRHSFIFYICHQLVFLGIFYLIGLAF